MSSKTKMESALLIPPEPHFAVALAAFNGALWLDEQLDSILAQKGVEVKIFVSVDPSVDGTEELVEKRAIQDHRIVLLPDRGRFGNAARNFYRLLRDIDLSGYDYLALADQDDIWLEDKLLRAATLMQRGEYVAYSSNVTAFWPDGREKVINKAQRMKNYDFLFEAAGPGATYVFTASFAVLMQKFIDSHADEVDKVSLHDWFFYAFARSREYRWLIDSRSGLMYRQHAANHLGANTGFPAFKHRVSSIVSGWYRQEVVKITRLCSPHVKYFSVKMDAGRWRSRWFVMRHISHCRRRLLDRSILFLCCLLGLF